MAGDPLAVLAAAGSDGVRGGAGAWTRRLDACARRSGRARARGPPRAGAAAGTAPDDDLRDRGRSVEGGPLRLLRAARAAADAARRSEAHTSALQSLMRNSYAVFCLKKKIKSNRTRLSQADIHKMQV